MYAHEYKLELQVATIIDTYHREAVRAEQLRLARTDRPSRTRAIETLRTSVRSLFTTAGDHMSQQPVSRPELVSTPSDTALIA